MTPYVIDKQKQLTIYIFFVLAIIISFGLGFVFGYQMTNIKSIILPDSVTEQSEVDTPATDEANKNEPAEDVKKTDADTQDQKKNNKPAEQTQARKAPDKTSTKKTPTKKVSSTSSKTSSTQPKKIVVAEKKIKKAAVKQVVVKKPVSKPIAASESQQTTVSTSDNQNADQSSVIASDATASTQKDTAENKKRYYSVQAGLFANQQNATKFLDELLSNGFDAYVQNFVSSGGTVKYNVRFGKSEDRETTRKRLAEFRQAFTTPAYVVIGN